MVTDLPALIDSADGAPGGGGNWSFAGAAFLAFTWEFLLLPLPGSSELDAIAGFLRSDKRQLGCRLQGCTNPGASGVRLLHATTPYLLPRKCAFYHTSVNRGGPSVCMEKLALACERKSVASLVKNLTHEHNYSASRQGS